MKNKNGTYGLCFIVCLLLLLVLPQDAGARNIDVLFFALGGDLEETSGALSEDLKEVLRFSNDSNVRVLALVGGSNQWYFPDLKSKHSYLIQIENGNLLDVSDRGVISLATVDALSILLEEGQKRFGYEEKILIFWGHGCHAPLGIGSDTVHDGDVLTLDEIATALNDKGSVYSLIGFDACDMANQEMILPLKPYTEHILVCNASESVSGWNYRWISGLNDVLSPTEYILQVCNQTFLHEDQDCQLIMLWNKYSPELVNQ